MKHMFELWRHIFLYPFLNGLIWLYNTVAFGNLGVAVIELTVILRLFLFPLTVISERNKAKYERLEPEVDQIAEAYKDDPVKMRERVREMLHRNRINPWAKASVLAIQGMVLIALYAVFQRGVTASLDGLYAWVQQPTMPINTRFLGLDIGEPSFYWAVAVGLILFTTIVIDQRKHAQVLGKSDALFRYAFPVFTVVLLSILPMVKTLFVLTSMVFSIIISNLRHAIWPTD